MIQRIQKGNKSLGLLNNAQFGRETFILSFVAYISVDFEKFASDLFHAGSALIKRKSYNNIQLFIQGAPNPPVAFTGVPVVKSIS